MPFRKLFSDIYVERKMTCCSCNIEKDIEDFVFMKNNKDHRSKVCRECVGTYEYNAATGKQLILKINGTH